MPYLIANAYLLSLRASPLPISIRNTCHILRLPYMSYDTVDFTETNSSLSRIVIRAYVTRAFDLRDI